MLNLVLKSTLALALLAPAISNASGNPTWYSNKLGRTSKPYYKVGGDKVIFGWSSADSCDTATLTKTALKIKDFTNTYKWDDLWYGIRIAPGECYVFGWYNLTAHTYGWAAVQNQPNTWAVRSNARGWENLSNGNQKKYSYKINGQTVDIDLFNPKNEGGLTGNDFLFSFGF